MTKRIFALLLALVLVVGLLPMGTLAAETPSAWDGTTVTEPKKVDGVYQIGTAEELAWFGQQSRRYGAANRTMQAKLTADIDLNNQDWAAYSVGDSGSYAYAGTFDGDGHTVKGYRIYKNVTKNSSAYLGFFGRTSKATIRNLILEGSVEIDMNGATARAYSGYVAGLVAEAKGTTIQNVVVDVDISLTNNDSKYGAFTTGGVAARVSFVSENGATTSDPKVITNSLIENCENRGNVVGGGSAGGIVGRTANCVTVRNCKNSGDITSVTTYAAGIVGDISGTTVEGCANTGSISGGYNAAGIAGNVSASHSTNAENPGTWVAVIRNCYNTGDVVCQGYSTSMDWYAAGIAGKSYGYIDLSNRDNNQNNIIENCYTTGKVTLGQESTKLHAAGFVGAVSYTQLANCYYLESAAEVSSTDATAAKNITAKTEDEMKSKDFAAALGEAYKVRSKDFPALTWEKVSGTVNVAVTANAEHALIRILDAEQNEIAANEDGTYPLETGKTYTYTARAAGYVTAIGTIDDVAAVADEGFVITMTKAAAYPDDLDAQWPSFRGNDENMAITKAATPTSADNSELLWATKLGTGWAAAPRSPIMVDGYIYTQVGTRILKLDQATGELVAEGAAAAASGFGIVAYTYGDGMLFVAENGGMVQAFNAETLESLWIYRDPLKGQDNCSVTYAGGYAYVGFWNSETRDANFVCLTVDDEDPSKTDEAKTALWTYTQAGGFYWAGAYVHGDYVLVGTDDGQSGYSSATANLLVFNRYNGKLVDSKTGYVGDIRSNVSYDADTDRIYFTSKGGWFYSERIDWTTGKILEESKSVKLGGMSTSTPVVYNGRAYVGVAGTSQFGENAGHNVSVIDLDTWTVAYHAYLNGYPQTSGLVSTAQDDDGYVYVYFCANYTPGGIFVVKDKPGVTEVLNGTEKNGKMYAPLVFNPESPLAQYCLGSPIADEYGTLYYKNDSCYIMAVSSKILGLTVESHETAVDGKYDDSKIEAYVELANGLRRPVSVKSYKGEDGEWYVSYTYGLAAGSYSKKTLTAPLHNFTGWQIQTEPTCDTEGLMVMKCEDCGETKTHTLAALGHDWDEGQVTKAATCTEEGEMTYTCQREGCDATRTEAIAKAPHDYKAVVTDPTCEGIGYTTYTCSVCGDSYVDDVVKALGHSYEEVVTAPTCDKMGYTTHTCKVCGSAYVDSFTDALDHDFVKTVTKEPTCTEEGEMTFTCAHEGCGETYTQPIPKADHKLEETKVEATCTEYGYTTYSCKNCDYSYVGEIVQPKGHDWDEGKTVLAANCVHEGMVKYTCAVCGEIKIETVEKTDHVWDEGKVTKEPTAYAEGEKTYTCTICGETRTEAIAKLGSCDGGKTCPSAKFTDVSAGQWYHEAVDYAVVNGLFAGTSDTTFSPNESMTRGMLVTVLWRLAGKPEAKAAASFQDVDAQQYYAKAVAWAAENGIVAGTSDTTFSPNAKVTREQMAAILYRYAKRNSVDVSKTADLKDFPDADKVASYAKDAMAWAVESGIISGTLKDGKTYLDPTGSATRAQVASILMRYAKTFG